MNYFFTIIFCFLSLVSQAQDADPISSIEVQLDNWHKAAANADFESYFGLMTEDAIFIGTDAEENWNYTAFKAFSKPYFDKGKAWSFTKLERNIYVSPEANLAWFDELLDTQMGICRGSGVMVLKNEVWKVQHYVLSIAIPNEDVKTITKLKQVHDSLLIKKLRSN